MYFVKRKLRWDDGYNLAGLFCFFMFPAGVAIARYLPEEWLPRCGFKLLVGVPCPTCGAWRGLTLLFKGDIAAAWRSQPFLLGCAVLLALVACYALVTAVAGWPRYYLVLSRWERRLAWLLVGLALFANWFFLIIDGR
jgi:hypothetical protein